MFMADAEQFSSSSDEEIHPVVIASSIGAVAMSSEFDDGYKGRKRGCRGNMHHAKYSWHRDDLSRSPIYGSWEFRARFRIPLMLIRRFEIELPEIEPDFPQRRDALRREGARPWQKIPSCLRRLADGNNLRTT